MAQVKVELIGGVPGREALLRGAQEEAEGRSILAKLEEFPWRHQICTDLVETEKELVRIQKANGLDFAKHFEALQQQVMVGVAQCEYPQLKKLKKPPVCAQLEEALAGCRLWLGKLSADETCDLTPSEFKSLVRPLGRLQQQVEAIYYGGSETRRYDAQAMEEALVRQRVAGLFEGLFRSLGSVRKVGAAGAPADGSVIFMPQKYSKKLHIYNLEEKKFSSVEVGLTFPRYGEMAITHVGDELYVAGGYGEGPAGGYCDQFHRLTVEGTTTALPKLSVAKSWFPMPFYVSEEQLITVGGYKNGGSAITDVESFSLSEGAWKKLPSLSKAIYGSSAVIIGGDNLYNIGGQYSEDSIQLLKLAEADAKWKAVPLAGQ